MGDIGLNWRKMQRGVSSMHRFSGGMYNRTLILTNYVECQKWLITVIKEAIYKVKSLFWVHIQAQSSALQTLTSTFPGHWAFTLHIHLDIHLNSLGSIQPLTRNLAPRLTNLPSQVPTVILGREKQCSVKCLAQGQNEQTHRQGIELGTWPRS